MRGGVGDGAVDRLYRQCRYLSSLTLTMIAVLCALPRGHPLGAMRGVVPLGAKGSVGCVKQGFRSQARCTPAYSLNATDSNEFGG